jgi:L-iditol 2-dehydrogenase
MSHGYGVGRSAMVLGLGPIGILTIAALRYSGAGLIIAQDLLVNRLNLAKRMGADVVLDGKLPLEERLSQVRELTSAVGPDVVIEVAGVPDAFGEALEFARRGGKVIEVGHYIDTGAAKIHAFSICYKDLDIHGS